MICLTEQDAYKLLDASEFGLEEYQCVPVGKSSDKKQQLWQMVDVPGDNEQVVQMLLD
jgi:hypothetical protein